MSDTQIIVEPGRQDIVIKRSFDAPREVVFRALTDPELIPSWWGPGRLETTVEQADVRPGGTWRFVQRDTDGSVYAFKGVFHDITAPERVVQTFEFEGVPGHVSLETATLTEAGGRTTYTGVSVFQSVEDRDAMVQSGMETGVNEGFERLDALLKTI